ncbi:MAG TPA: aldo/keto reductase [Steroidobacteraceae bacterium]|nr:aldo/keto reductase [Steroidobacteraceae bacterium]
MRYVNLGSSGLKVSQLCLGCMSFGKGQMHGSWTLGQEESKPFFRIAIENGINFFDTADAYGEGASELVVGAALREYARRDEVVITTKFLAPTGSGQNERGASRKHIMAAVDASLRRLQVDYIDLYLQHGIDPTTPMEETLRALDDLVRTGKVLHIGASNYKAWQLAKAIKLQALNRWTPFTSMQVQYNLIYREEEREMIPLCQDQGIGVTAWSALARGFLAGNRSADGPGKTARAKGDAFARQLYFRKEDFAVQEQLAKVAAARGVSPMQVALAWIKGRPGLTAPIIGATRVEQLEQAIAALELELSNEERVLLENAYVTRSPAFG